jgi:membrane AbrB-like protein
MSLLNEFKISIKSIIIGFFGALIGIAIKLPLPWLLGALLGNLILSFFGIKNQFSNKLFTPVLIIVGIILAASFNITLLYKIHLWVFSSIGMIICTFLGGLITAIYFSKICKYNKLDAIFAGLPGAFVPVTAAYLELSKNKKNLSKVVIPQATRVMFIVLFVPFFFVYEKGYEEIITKAYTPDYNVKYFVEIIFLILISLLFTIFLRKIKIPSAPILASMAAAGIMYTFEIVDAKFSSNFINAIFLLLGSSLGCRMSGLKFKEIVSFSVHGSIISLILILLAMIFAYLLDYLFGLNFMATFLSFAPGGIHEMILISIAYNIDPLFVSYHHFLRIFIIILSIPILIKIYFKN